MSHGQANAAPPYDAMKDVLYFYKMCGESHWTLDQMMRAYSGLCFAIARTNNETARQMFYATTLYFEILLSKGVWSPVSLGGDK